MKKSFYLILIVCLSFIKVNGLNFNHLEPLQTPVNADSLAQNVVDETLRSWQAYKQYAWGHDVFLPLTKSYSDWYKEPLYISPIDAYSTLFLMGLHAEAQEIEQYVMDSLDFNKDVFAKTFEVNIRILGGLLSMYELSQNPKVLEKAIDFGDRILPAFNTQTGIPTYWVNLKTGATKGDTVNVAEAGTYLIEMGVLSHYTQNPKYYQAARKATLAIFNRRSSIGLIGDIIDVHTGVWVSKQSHICAGVDSYYEYMYKSFLLFGDQEMESIWKESLIAIQKYNVEVFDRNIWYARVHMETGDKTSSVMTLYDAFFPALLAVSGNMNEAKRYQKSWDWLWHRYGLEPTVYDYKKQTVNYPVYDLNPEIMESAYYLYHFTGDTTYFNMNVRYWESIKKHCRTDVAFTAIEDVRTMKQGNEMATFFFAETLKYLYLTFSYHQEKFSFEEYVFNTEAHPFKVISILKM